MNNNEERNVLVRFRWDCRRMGVVEGLFITTHKQLVSSYGKDVYFGEILGKHSDVYGVLEEDDFKVVTDDQEFIAKTIDLIGYHISGYNPFSYIRNEDD